MFSMHECFPLLIANRNLSFSECLIISLFQLSLIHFCSMIENLKSLLLVQNQGEEARMILNQF